VIEAGSADPMPPSKWDPESLKTLTQQYEIEARTLKSYNGMFEARGAVDEATRHLAAAAWGGNPEREATYLNYSGQHEPGKCYTATYKVPENNPSGRSISMATTAHEVRQHIVNSSNAKLNADGTFTVLFGSKELCGDKPNRVDVTPGWNFVMRIYRPGPSVLDGSYVLPAAKPVD
jgi:hypothetical protein